MSRRDALHRELFSVLALLIALFLACAAQVAFAQPIVDTPVLNPANPVAGQTVNVELHGNPCVLYVFSPDSPGVITRKGNAITLLVQAIVSGDADFCIYPTFTVSYPIGAYGAGEYTVQVDAQYQILDGTTTQTLGTLSFIVTGPKRVPAMSTLMLLLLASLMGVAVWIMARRGFVSLR
jgi:hypothetical protein